MRVAVAEIHRDSFPSVVPLNRQCSFNSVRRRCYVLVCALLINTGTVNAAPLDVAFKVLSDGNAVAIMRSALTLGTSTPPGSSQGDCQTQRNLSVAGRVQSEVIGELFRSQGITHAQVFSSELCRSKDTAALLQLGIVKTLPALNAISEDRSAAESHTGVLMKELESWLAAPSVPVVLVTHHTNIQALTQTPTNPGEILIVTLAKDAVVVLASIPTEY